MSFLKNLFGSNKKARLIAQQQQLASQAQSINAAQANDAAQSRQLGMMRRRARGNAVLRYAKA